MQRGAGKATAVRRRPLIVAHRGGAHRAAENTLAAFAEGVATGADMIEFDVRRTADGVLVTVHDSAVGGVPVGQLTLGELRARLPGAPPATAEELLAWAADRVAVDVELKEAGCGEEVVALARRHGTSGRRLLVTSFLDEALAEARGADAKVATGLIVEGDARPADAVPAQRLAALAPTYLVPSVELTEQGFLAYAEQLGTPCFVWTVNERASLAKLLAHRQVAGVITDVPAVALAVSESLGRG
jgi:glycerophosphoryl diester phosphodiesterase